MTFEEWLEGKLDWAARSSEESRMLAPNSWGAGYDCGYADALQFLFASLPKSVAHVELAPEDAAS